MGSRNLDYWCWLVIHIISLHWLFIQIYIQIIFSTLRQVHQLSHFILCINNFLSYQLHIFFNMHVFHFQDSKKKWDLPIHLLLLLFLNSHVHYIWKNWHSNLQAKSWNPPIVLCELGIHLSPHSRATHNSIPYIKHYFPHLLVSSTRIKLRENPFYKHSLIPNFEWSNYSLIQGLHHFCSIRW